MSPVYKVSKAPLVPSRPRNHLGSAALLDLKSQTREKYVCLYAAGDEIRYSPNLRLSFFVSLVYFYQVRMRLPSSQRFASFPGSVDGLSSLVAQGESMLANTYFGAVAVSVVKCGVWDPLNVGQQ